MFHKHNWEIISKTYAPNLEELNIKHIEKLGDGWAGQCLMQGLTTILWKCSICQKTRKEEMLGKLVSEV